MSSRTTRSQSANIEASHTRRTDAPVSQTESNLPTIQHETCKLDIQSVSEQELKSLLQHLPKRERLLLREKQEKLQEDNAQVPAFVSKYTNEGNRKSLSLAQAAMSTLVFAGESAGTAVCISSGGLLLTCAHCIAETEDDYKPSEFHWLLFASGHPVQALCIAWDARRDLALLQITVIESSLSNIPFIKLATAAPKVKCQMLCIGHPGSEDFEADCSGVATEYDILHISEGRFRGMAKDQDPEDNSEIGALMHDCWTYWGHSGAPLIAIDSGMLLGLHSSWDDKTAMRRGVGWKAIKAFLDEETIIIDNETI